MNQYHTTEPWRVEYKQTGTYIFSNEPNLLLLSMSHTNSTKVCNENAQRIVACVNAMEGIANPERWMQEAKNIIDRIIDYSHPEMKLGDSKIEALFRHAKERDRLREAFGEFADMLMKIRRSNEAEGGVGNSLESRQITELLNKYIP